jgi:tetratricopeptide (TPR) repeat protein
VSWSYDLLSEPERSALRRLAVCPGGWTLQTATALLRDEPCPEILEPAAEGESDDWEVVDLLNQLIDKSLVLTTETPAGAPPATASEPPQLRYGMLETIRQYALERLRETGDEDAVRERHAAWFTGFTLEAQVQLAGPNSVAWLQRLSRDLENLRQAVRWCEAHGSPERSLRLTSGLARLWTWLGQSSEGRASIAASVARYPDPPAKLGASAWGSLATLAWFQSDFAAARQSFEKCLALWRSVGDRRGEGYALNNLGLTASRQGDLDGASRYYEQALAIMRDAGEQRGIVNALHNLGSVARLRDDLPAARRLLEEGLAVAEALGDVAYLQTIKNTLGLVARREGRLEEALRLLQEVLAWDSNAGDRRGVASAKHNLGLILRDLGRMEEARQHQEEALAIGREVEDLVIVAASLHNLSQLALLEDDRSRAAELCGESLLIAVEMEDRVGIAGSLEAFAELALLGDRPACAAALLGAAARLREEAGAPVATPDRPTYQRIVDTTRERLGSTELDAAWRRGAESPISEVTQQALALRELS